MAPRKSRFDHSTHGETRETEHNVWTKDTKMKTAKCRLCSHKIELYSWKCSSCAKWICNQCCEPDSSAAYCHKRWAADHLEEGCWCKRFPMGMNPALADLRRDVPDKHLEQRQRDLETKKKAAATRAKRKAEQAASNEPSGEQKRRADEVVEDEEEDEDATYIPPPSAWKSSRKRPIDDDEYEDELESRASPRSQPRKKTKTASGPSRTSVGQDDDLPPTFSNPFKPVKQRTTNQHSRKANGSSSTIEETEAAPATKVQQQPASALEGGHTVIVGGGIVGLFTAFGLAVRCQALGITHRITVVEVRNDVCELASGACAGILTERGMPHQAAWRDRLANATTIWQNLTVAYKPSKFGLVEDRRVGKKRSKWAPQYAMHVAREAKRSPDTLSDNGVASNDDEGIQAPFWFAPDQIHRVDDDKEAFGRIDPRMLADWLKAECQDKGVAFLLGHRPDRLQRRLNKKDEPVGWLVHLTRPGAPSEKTEPLKASHLVFAAGPFTTDIIRNLFGKGKDLPLGNYQSKALWIDLPLGQQRQKDLATADLKHRSSTSNLEKQHFQKAADDAERAITVSPRDDWSDENMTMVVRPGHDKLEISTALFKSTAAHVSVRDAIFSEQVEFDIEPLKKLAGKYHGLKLTREEEAAGNGSGAWISTGKGKKPYVGRLVLPDEEVEGGFVKAPRVWLSYGFGRYGTTLAPAAAKEVVDLMVGSR